MDIATIISIGTLLTMLTGFILFYQKQRTQLKDRMKDEYEKGVQRGKDEAEMAAIKKSLDASHDKHRKTVIDMEEIVKRLTELEAQNSMMCETLKRIESKIDNRDDGK
jgi:hypothetical protein